MVRNKKMATRRMHWLTYSLLLSVTWLGQHTIASDQQQDPASRQDDVAQDAPAEIRLAFSFNGAPWREVLNWLAEETGLALHVGELPAGSFTYSDPQQFSTEEAISRLNLFLIPQGYSVVRRGQLLSVITLGDPRSMQQLDALAELVSRDELSLQSKNSIVKCMIPLAEIDAQAAIAELKPLQLMTTPVVLPQSNQLIIVDTAEKLRSVYSVIDAMQAVPQDQVVVKRLKLRHTDFDTVMTVAGTHLGLEGGMTSSGNLSMSSDISGSTLFVSGNKAQVEKLESLLAVIDVAEETATAIEELVLKSHPVTAGSLQSVYDVLVTILGEQEIRLSMESKTSSIVALADPKIHQKIQQTIEELKAPATEFVVVDLQTLDPYFAITLLGEMFGDVQQDSERNDRRRDEDEESSSLAPPRIDADPENRRLFVRGTREQIVEIQQILRSLDTQKQSAEEVRVVPLRGTDAKKLLEFAKEAWSSRGDVIIIPSGKNSNRDVLERTLNSTPQRNSRIADGKRTGQKTVKSIPDDQTEGQTSDSEKGSKSQDEIHGDDEIVTGVRSTRISSPFEDTDNYVAVTTLDASAQDLTTVATRENGDPSNSKESASEQPSAAEIRSQLTPQGIVLQSDDIEALDEFESLLRQVGNIGKGQISPPVAYYLKYVSAEEAVRMLADLLDGENALATSPSGTLVNGGSISSTGSGYFGSLLYSRDGRTTVSAGSATIVSDARLNRLIVQGTTDDIALVEKYLKLIDKGESITDIETFGRSHVVELVHSKADDVAEVIREAFRGRILGEENNQQRSPRDPREPGREEDRREEGQESRETVEKPTRGRQAEMTVAVHEPSNSLIITAPDPLFKEVESLIKTVDTNSEQVIQVIPAGDGVDMEAIMQRVMGLEATSNSNSRTNSSNRTSRDQSRSRSSNDRDRSPRR